MEDKYITKDGKIVENVSETWFNEYNHMSFRTQTAYKQHLEQLKKEESQLIKSFMTVSEEFH
jgi:hypothetical protein